MITESIKRIVEPFNGPVEIGLRSLTILTNAFPNVYSLQRLVILDYLVVHSDDIPDGPSGLHPQTPHRGGELLVRRKSLQEGLLLFQSRGLIERRFENSGVYFGASEQSASFLDSLNSEYIVDLRSRASWLVERFGQLPDADLEQLARKNIGGWGAEFTMESVLWVEDEP